MIFLDNVLVSVKENTIDPLLNPKNTEDTDTTNSNPHTVSKARESSISVSSQV